MDQADYGSPIRYVGPKDEDRPAEYDVGVALTVLGLSDGRDHLGDARRLIASLDKVGVGFGDMREWRRNFLDGHVRGENEDHRLAGVIADQADEIDRLRWAIQEHIDDPSVPVASPAVQRLRAALDQHFAS